MSGRTMSQAARAAKRTAARERWRLWEAATGRRVGAATAPDPQKSEPEQTATRRRIRLSRIKAEARGCWRALVGRSRALDRQAARADTAGRADSAADKRDKAETLRRCAVMLADANWKSGVLDLADAWGKPAHGNTARRLLAKQHGPNPANAALEEDRAAAD